jgi:hypothetical protein
MFIPQNQKAISKLIDFRKSMEYVREVKNTVRQEFEFAKRTLISDFENHPVTKEIDAGVNASNSSGTLGGKGNLFSFIGFKSGDTPTTSIRIAFDKIFLTSTMVKRDGSSESFVLYPSADDIFRITPLPWAEGRSWAEGIEKGISNFGHYLNKETEYSRSGRGVQSKSQVTSSDFRPQPYISEMISQFEISIQKVGVKIV